jgi:hypothetical protein
MYVAGRMVLRLFVESHGTLVAVSAPFVMPLRDLDIPMNVPITFRNKQPFPLGYPITPTTPALLYIVVARATSAQKKMANRLNGTIRRASHQSPGKVFAM